MSAITLRAPTSSDHDDWLALWRGYQTFYKVDLSPVAVSTTWARLLDPAEPMWAMLAFDGDRAAGLVHWIRHRSTWTPGDYVYLQDLFVAETTRGGGIGRKLIEHVYATAREMGAARVYWLTHEGNATAMQLYDRIADRSGFIQYRKVLG